MMTKKQKTIAALALALAVGYSAGRGSEPPQPSRPVLSFLAKAARAALWLAFLGDSHQPAAGPRIVQHTIGEDGYETINHGRSL